MPGMLGNDTATLMSSQQVWEPKLKCLTFWYHMFGRDPATFGLYMNIQKNYVGSTLLWVKRLPQSNNWLMAQITITSDLGYYLMFRATMVSNSKDNIGIDDISFTDGACPVSRTCDFEVNLYIPYKMH